MVELCVSGKIIVQEKERVENTLETNDRYGNPDQSDKDGEGPKIWNTGTFSSGFFTDFWSGSGQASRVFPVEGRGRDRSLANLFYVLVLFC